MRELATDLSEESRELLFKLGEKDPFCGIFLDETGRGYIPPVCADYRCSKPSQI